MKNYEVSGMHCAACSARVERTVSALEGVTECNVNLLTNSMTVEGSISPEVVIKAVKKAGYGAKLTDERISHSSDISNEDEKEKKKLLYKNGYYVC